MPLLTPPREKSKHIEAKPDFRIANQYVMIELVPRESPSPLVTVFVRVDDDLTFLEQYEAIASDEIFKKPRTFTEDRPGTKWLTFDVRNETEAAQAVDLLAAAYKSRSILSW